MEIRKLDDSRISSMNEYQGWKQTRDIRSSASLKSIRKNPGKLLHHSFYSN